MAHALRLARRGLYTADPNPRVGCVIVDGNDVVGKGWHVVTGGAHAEVAALRDAGDSARGATAYVTLEPCNHQGRTAPCTQALLEAGIKRVVAAVKDPNPHVQGGGLHTLEQAGVDTACDIMAGEARALNCGFFKRAATGLPWVRLKIASSLDGRTAMASGESRWITGEAARQDVQYWRARSSCILTGRGTVLADDPSLNVRLEPRDFGVGGKLRQPLRVVLDSCLQTPPAAHLLNLDGEVLLLCDSRYAERRYKQASVAVRAVPTSGASLDLPAVLALLASEHQANEVHVEAGATLSGALLAADLVDEILCYMSTDLLGNDTRAFASLPLQHMAERKRWRLHELRKLGDDLRLRLRCATTFGAQEN
ncbi:MAG: bifunctional diaminohydroxyphosphoribosylaminopyrimidine deaminase/5-amino-6-(5-phosphoribosylamino)uracil reductase RibD [Gammaproteobacteria bacterium]|nr:bifunctional diaminohydroxyphosphoribosylaminopyrimidine deaminase/5-amino-6-(5-phosphoribosylamino)uracil reductase RibD [Gammaproteobacteria bacterium]